jgi:hypothetical protein
LPQTRSTQFALHCARARVRFFFPRRFFAASMWRALNAAPRRAANPLPARARAMLLRDAVPPIQRVSASNFV